HFGSRTHDDAVKCLERSLQLLLGNFVGSYCKTGGFEQIFSCGINAVVGEYFKHQALFFSNSCITSTKTCTLSMGMALYIEARKPPTERWPLSPLMLAALSTLLKASSKAGFFMTKQTFI